MMCLPSINALLVLFFIWYAFDIDFDKFLYIITLFKYRAQHIEGTSTAFSNAQIADHYANCIKLSSENVSSLAYHLVCTV